MPPDIGTSETVVVLRTPLGNLSSIRKLFPSLIFTSRKRSPRGDDNLEQAEVFLRITQDQLDAIHKASQQASNTYAEEINHIKNDLDKMNSWLNTVKKARESETTLKQTLQRLGNDAATKDVLQAARRLSKKAKHTSARVASEYSIIPNNELPTQIDLSGIGFSFDRKPTADDTKKIEDVIRLVDPEFYSDDDSSGSVRALRSRKSDLSTYSYHYWGPDAYNTGGSRAPSGDTSSQLSSPISRTSTGMQLGGHATFNQCNITILNMQSNDSSSVSDATSNLGTGFVGRDTPLLPSAVHGSPSPSCDVSRGAEAMQANVTSLQDAAVAVDDIRSAPERYSSAASSSQAQSDNQAVNMQSGEEATRQALPLTAAGTQNAKSHSLTVSGSAMVSSPTMNFNSPGATGATNTYFGTQPAHSPPPEASTQNRHLEGPGFKCMEFTDDSVVYNPTFNDESPDASGAYNQEIPAAGS